MNRKEWRKLDKILADTSKEDKSYRCEVCGRTKEQGWQIHHHHFIKRTHTALRWVLQNIFVLCAKCHADIEGDPQLAVRIARDYRGEKWYKLIDKIKGLTNKKTFVNSFY